MDVLNPIIAGAVAGSSSLLVVHPMDTIRTRVQTNPEFKGVIDCFRKTTQTEGPSAFYKGVVAPFLAQGVYKAVMFGSFTASSRFLNERNSKIEGHKGGLTPLQLFLCGSFSGIINSFVVTPVELIRNNLMVNRSDPTVTIRSVVRDAFAQNGIAGLWKGQLSCSFRDGLGVGAFFYGNNRAAAWLNKNTSLSPSTAQLFAGMVAGICFWTVALPIDRVKSIIQTSKDSASNPFTILSNIFKTQGIRGLYRGLPVGLGRGIPGGAVTFYVNHKMMDFLTTKPSAKKHSV